MEAINFNKSIKNKTFIHTIISHSKAAGKIIVHWLSPKIKIFLKKLYQKKLAQVNVKDIIKLVTQILYIKKFIQFVRQDAFQNRGQKMGFYNINLIMFPSFFNSAKDCEEMPISDVESDNKSLTNQKLCISFQSLMKKQEIQCSTRNTQWTQQQKNLMNSFTKSKPHQNSKKPQNKHITTIWNIQCEQDQNSSKIILEKKQKSNKSFGKIQKIQLEKKQNQEIQNLKNHVIKSRDFKIKKLKEILPYYYTQQLPANFKKLLKVAQKIDSYLIEKYQNNSSNHGANQSKAHHNSFGYFDNIQNILGSIFHDQQSSSIWSMIKQIIFLADDYYQIKIDPLKNLCLGFGGKKCNKNSGKKIKQIVLQNDENSQFPSISAPENKNKRKNSYQAVDRKWTRKQRLRKIVADYYIENKQYLKNNGNQISQALIQPQKIVRFYPQNLNITKKYQQKQSQNKKLKPQFVQNLKQTLLTKQCILEHKQSQIQQSNRSSAPSSPPSQPQQLKQNKKPQIISQLKTFCEHINKIYQLKKVKNMYKVSLIEHLRDKYFYPLQKIFKLLKYLMNEQIFIEVKVTDSGCQILKIRPYEMEKFLEIVQIRILKQIQKDYQNQNLGGF